MTDTTHGKRDRVTIPDDSPGRIWLPRWVVYAQAILLGVATIAAFVFGLMVGQLTAPLDSQKPTGTCAVTGTVWANDQAQQPDPEAVVIFLPIDTTVHVRFDPEPIAPLSFRPLQNPVIDQISAWGGGVVRTDERGQFHVPLDAGRRYWLVIVSKNKERGGPLQLNRQEMAAVAKYFLPIEALFRDRAFVIRMVEPRGETMEIPHVRWN